MDKCLCIDWRRRFRRFENVRKAVLNHEVNSTEKWIPNEWQNCRILCTRPWNYIVSVLISILIKIYIYKIPKYQTLKKTGNKHSTRNNKTLCSIQSHCDSDPLYTAMNCSYWPYIFLPTVYTYLSTNSIIDSFLTISQCALQPW